MGIEVMFFAARFDIGDGMRNEVIDTVVRYFPY